MANIKHLMLFTAVLCAFFLGACGTDEPDMPGDSGSSSQNNSSITIKADGSTSSPGVVFSPIDEKSFYIDYIKYAIVESHLEIVGYDKVEIAKNVKPFATVKFNGVTYQTRNIQEEAFMGAPITSIKIPSTVVEIGFKAFYYCMELTQISFPDGLTDIGCSAFHKCEGLTSISLPDDLTFIGWYAFSECEGLTSISLPDGITSIDDGLFQKCKRLTSVSFPNGLTSIGNYAFEDCYRLTSVPFPEGLISIGDRAFGYCNELTEITLPSTLDDIGSEAFVDCIGLKSITCLSLEPPSMEYSSFSIVHTDNLRDHNYIYNTVQLYVPGQAVEAYKADVYWGRFKNITSL